MRKAASKGAAFFSFISRETNGEIPGGVFSRLSDIVLFLTQNT